MNIAVVAPISDYLSKYGPELHHGFWRADEDGVTRIVELLRTLGHGAGLVEPGPYFGSALLGGRSGPPDLILNQSRGIRGTTRRVEVPAVAESLGVEYTGSGVYSAALTSDRSALCGALRALGVPTVGVRALSPSERLSDVLKDISGPLLVLSNSTDEAPPREDSLARSAEDAGIEIERLVLEEDVRVPALVQYVDGVDVSCLVLPGSPSKVLGLVQVFLEDNLRLFGLEAKALLDEGYVVSLGPPRNLCREIIPKLKELAASVVDGLDLQSWARVDFRVLEGRVPFVTGVEIVPDLTREGTRETWSMELADTHLLDILRGVIGEGQPAQEQEEACPSH